MNDAAPAQPLVRPTSQDPRALASRRAPGAAAASTSGRAPGVADASGSPRASASAPLLEARSLVYRYPGADGPAVNGISLRAEPGKVGTVLGPNGSGKSTLLRLLAGGARPRSGRVRFAGRPLDQWPRRAVAAWMAVVTQHEHVPFPVTARSLVAMGRYARLGPWRREGRQDREAVARAMERCGVAGLEDRDFRSLSGGERQRVRIARALAQEPSVLLLDEPTAALDMRYETTVFRLLRELARSDGVAVVAVTHHLNLAARFGDRHLLMESGAQAAQGDADNVLTAANISRVYRCPVTVASRAFPEGLAPQVSPD